MSGVRSDGGGTGRRRGTRLLADQSERAFTAQVVRTLQSCGWLTFHPWSSLHSAAGWPDVAAVRDGVLLLVELKVKGKRPAAAQQEWLLALARVPGTLVRVWTPAEEQEIAYVAVHGVVPRTAAEA